jgi:hypothetical protein
MNVEEALCSVERGYCLWVGAGLTVQLAGGPHHAPDWLGITRHMEQMAGLPPSTQPNPERLEACATQLGTDIFRRELRKAYYTSLSKVLLAAAQRALDSGQIVPPRLRQIEALGRVANPIVSFNIEPFSSYILARPMGPCRVVFYSGAEHPAAAWDEAADSFKRLVYHPHGMVTSTCTMTSSDYARLNGGLALQLAVHAAFGNNLVIVGLSLEDQYLRNQISQFRQSINRIFWFDTSFSAEAASWAAGARVDAIRLPDWPSFWDTVERLLYGGQPAPYLQKIQEGLYAAWYRVLDEAHREAMGGVASETYRVLSKSSSAGGLAGKAGAMGEPGNSVLPPELQGTFRQFSDFMISKRHSIPEVSVTF